MGGQQQQQRSRVMGNQSPQPQPQQTAPPPQADNPQPQPDSQEKEKKETQQIRPEDIDLLEMFQAKLVSEDQREELAEGIGQIGALIEDDLDGMDTTLEDLQAYVTSEKLENQIENLKEQGLL